MSLPTLALIAAPLALVASSVAGTALAATGPVTAVTVVDVATPALPTTDCRPLPADRQPPVVPGPRSAGGASQTIVLHVPATTCNTAPR